MSATFDGLPSRPACVRSCRGAETAGAPDGARFGASVAEAKEGTMTHAAAPQARATRSAEDDSRDRTSG